MKVLFLSAGNSIHTVKWVNALARRGNEVHLIYNKNHTPVEDMLDQNIICHCLKYGGTLGYYLNALELKKITKVIKPDVINVHFASGYGTLARIARIGPVLLSIWGSDVYDFPYESKIKNIILKRNVKYADMIASTSYCMARQLRKVMEDKNLNIDVTPFGVDICQFNPMRFEKKESEDILIGNIKILRPKYGIDIFIKSISLLLDMLKKDGMSDVAKRIRVEIYGDGEQKEELMKLTEELALKEVVHFMGKIPNVEVPEKLSNFDIFCATSVLNSESFGVAVVEAMAMEVPVVVSDVDGFSEVVENQKTGIIVEKGDIEKLADALKKMILNPDYRKELGKSGRKRVKELYNWDDNVTTMEKLYKKMLMLHLKQ